MYFESRIKSPPGRLLKMKGALNADEMNALSLALLFCHGYHGKVKASMCSKCCWKQGLTIISRMSLPMSVWSSNWMITCCLRVAPHWDCHHKECEKDASCVGSESRRFSCSGNSRPGWIGRGCPEGETVNEETCFSHKHEYVRSQELLPQTARVCGLEEKLRAVEERVSAWNVSQISPFPAVLFYFISILYVLVKSIKIVTQWMFQFWNYCSTCDCEDKSSEKEISLKTMVVVNENTSNSFLFSIF